VGPLVHERQAVQLAAEGIQPAVEGIQPAVEGIQPVADSIPEAAECIQVVVMDIGLQNMLLWDLNLEPHQPVDCLHVFHAVLVSVWNVPNFHTLDTRGNSY